MESLQQHESPKEYETWMDANRVLAAILDIGELLLESGAEVMRVEDTITRLCQAYGFLRSDVFTITSSIVLTVQMEGGRVMPQTRRVRTRQTDLGAVEKLNALSREVCARRMPVELLNEKIEMIRTRKPAPFILTAACYAVISAVFSVFFGGNGYDAVTAAVSGIVLCLSLLVMSRMHVNAVIENMLCSAATAFAVMLMVRAGLGMHPDKIIIGNIMLLIPGIQLTTSLRDIFNEDMIAGLLGLAEAVLKALAIALGFAFVLIRMGG